MADLLPPPESDEVWLSRRVLAVRRVAEGGEPAVLLHGLGGSALNWTDLGYELAGTLDSWAVDLPGFGASPPPRDGNYGLSAQARAVYDLISERIGSPVHVFGNSLGGAIGLQVAARAPSWVRSLTMVSPALPGARLTSANMHLPVLALPGVGEAVLRRYSRYPAEARAWGTVQVCFADTSRMHRQRLAEAVAEVEQRDALQYVPDAFARSIRALMASLSDRGPQRPLALARRITAPALLVYGARDRLVDARGASRIAARFQQASVVVLPDCAHVAHMEHPEMVAGAWRDLIGRRRTPPRGSRN